VIDFAFDAAAAALSELTLAQLHSRLTLALTADYRAEQSDNRYHTSGRYDDAQAYIRTLRAAIKRLEERHVCTD
jgi:hypothetical protein